jgi:hypothetical protein
MVDVEAIRLDADRNDLGAQLPERRWRDLVGGAIGAIEHDAQTAEIGIGRQRALGIFDVAGTGFFLAIGAADLAAMRQQLGHVAIDEGLDFQLELIAELITIRTEQLDAVVIERIVRERVSMATAGVGIGPRK